MKDALNRRSRFANPQPYFTAPDVSKHIDILKNIDRHGPLPTPLIMALDDRKNYGNMQRRLTRLFNGYCEHPDHRSKNKDGHTCRTISHLSRDPRQWKNAHAFHQHAVYGLTKHAIDILEQRGELARPFSRSNSYVHDLFLSCFTASFEVQARRFRFRDELLDHPKCPPVTRAETSPFYFLANGKEVHPDDILSNEYEEGRTRFFALEVDCANESTAKTETKLRDYQEVLRSFGFSRLGLPNITILYPTVTEFKAAKILQLVKQLDVQFQPFFLTKVFPNFADTWRVPSEPLEVMTGWQSATGQVDISRKATP